MEKIYQPIEWEDFPSEKTPISSENLGKMDLAINEIDNRVVEHDDRVAELERVIDSGGGDSQIDPRRIPDMYYKESGGVVEILPETTFTVDLSIMADEEKQITPAINLEVGDEYAVRWNGVEYKCIATEFEMEGVTGIYIGMAMDGTGEYPFSFVNAPDMFGDNTFFVIEDGSTSVTVSIAQVGAEVIHTIPEEYLGLDWLPKIIKNETVLFEEQTVIVDELVGVIGNYKSYDLGLDKETRTKMVEEYESLTVVVDGTVIELPYVKKFGATAYFTRIPYDSMSEAHFGMVAVGSGINNTASVAIEIGEHTLKVSHTESHFNKMPVEYLPDGVPYLCGGNVEILPEQDIPVLDAEDGMYGLTSDYPELVVGETYTVTYNGSKYTCVGQDASAMQEGGVGIGDMAALELGNGNGEPFAVCYAPETALVVIPLDGASAVKLAIETNGQIVRKLPEECLPESVDSVIIRSSTEGSTKKFKLTVDDSGKISATEIVE